MRTREKKDAITVRRELEIVNELGLHARPAARFVSCANSFHSEIWLVKDGRRFSGTSLVDVLRAELDCGATVILEAQGIDAEAAAHSLARLVAELDRPESLSRA